MPSKGANTPRFPLKEYMPNTTAMIITVLIILDTFPGSLFTKALIKSKLMQHLIRKKLKT